MQGTFVVVDLETTGLDYKLERILEIGAVRMVNGEIREPFHALVDPLMEIPNTAIHGIDNQMVSGAPTIEEVLPKFLEYLGNDPFVAHNAIFDYNFINHNAQQYLNTTIDNPMIDTLAIAKEVFPQDKSHSLETLLSKLNQTSDGMHRALNDTMALAKIFPTLWELRRQKQAYQRSQFERIDYVAQRFSDLGQLIKGLQHEYGELRRVLELYFAEGGETINLHNGDQVVNEAHDSWEYNQDELKELFEQWEMLDRVQRIEKSRLERWLKGDRLTEDQKAQILTTRRYLGTSNKVAIQKECASNPSARTE